MSIRNWMWRRESPLARSLYSGLKKLARADFPIVPGVHHLLLAERRFRKGPLSALWSKVYHEPIFRMLCSKCGSGLLLYENMPKLLGDLAIDLGDDITLSGDQVWMAGGSGVRSRLTVGNKSYIGHAVQIISGNEVTIGAHVLIANRVVLNGYDGHPLDPLARARNEPPGPDGIGPIHIGDYSWIGNDVTVLKNVSIGRGAVVASGSIVTGDVPDLAVVAGVPARILRYIDAPEGW